MQDTVYPTNIDFKQGRRKKDPTQMEKSPVISNTK